MRPGRRPGQSLMVMLGEGGWVVLVVTKLRKDEIRADLDSGCQGGACVAYARSL